MPTSKTHSPAHVSAHTSKHTQVWPAVLVAVLALVVVAVAGFLFVAFPAWSAAEVKIVAAVQGAQNGFFDLVALTIDVVFGVKGAAFVALIVLAVVFALRRSWRLTIRFGLLVLVPWIVVEILSYLLMRPRPDPDLLAPIITSGAATYSFPSGHVAFAAALVCAVAFLLAHGKLRLFWVIFGALVVLVVAWSRVYLAVHYPTDVIAAMFLVPFISVAVDRVLARWKWFVG